jgi:hypothetical protein
MTQRYLNLKKLLIAEAVLIPIYIVFLRWFENHYAPCATMFTGLVPPWDYDLDGPRPVAAVPAALTMLIGGGPICCSWQRSACFGWSNRGACQAFKPRGINEMKKHWSVGDRTILEPYGEGHVTEVLSGGLFLRVQWPIFDSPQLVTTVDLPKVNTEDENDD